MISLTIENGIAALTLSRPPVNALDEAMLEAVNGALDKVEASDARVLILQSDQKSFCAGADLAMINTLFSAPSPSEAMRGYAARLHATFDRIEALPQVSLAVINGHALGGGLELALSCDMRIAAEEASLGLPEAAVGLLPGAGGTQRLTQLCGPGVARRIILSAERINGAEAERVGLAQWVFPRATLAEEAMAIATRIAGLSPASLQASKRCIAAAGSPERAGFALEQREICALMNLDETRQRIAGFFKR
ncbi:MAG: enoyl-CoA hydratase/isomerase family protein [Proteobacteria bacterium]|nr:enoyl-CoA hydratase/isomerase family protein [Pseudomonadota bacterium]